jgi:hypothetical protein
MWKEFPKVVNGVEIVQEMWDYPKHLNGGAGSVGEFSTVVHDYVQWKEGIDLHDAYNNLRRVGFAVFDIDNVANSAEGGGPITCPSWGYPADRWEDRALWYPMQVRITMVAVAKDATFSGWDEWVSTPPTDGTSSK